MKNTYLELMEITLSAYSDAHIKRYFEDVKKNGLTEHGFPRLSANIGILIAHGRRRDLLPLFLEMMDFCCRTIPCVKAANDFSVREIVSCLLEIERSGLVELTRTNLWREGLASIEPTSCYTRFVTSPTDGVRNWALFTAVSEFYRQKAGLCDSREFIELQLKQQLQWLDEEGMYRDNTKCERRNPIVYDLVPRALFSMLLDGGYRGAHYGAIDDALRRAGLLTLDMQSPTGEIAFGGRSNQFLHNEPLLSAVFEFEAKRYAKEGNAELEARFRAASARAIAVTREWLCKEPIRHIKNRFPTETCYGCEGYAYFDKYMITVASNLWAAYQISDGAQSCQMMPDTSVVSAVTSPFFHKLFLKSRGYGLEFDLFADPACDAGGLGRVHRTGAPSAICLSLPCAKTPRYCIDHEPDTALSLSSAVFLNGEWRFGASPDASFELLEHGTRDGVAYAELICRLPGGAVQTEAYEVDASGVSVTLSRKGLGEVAYSLPVLTFDGEKSPVCTAEEQALTVSYQGWKCRYRTNGEICDTGLVACNRNGHYRAFVARSQKPLTLKIEIVSL